MELYHKTQRHDRYFDLDRHTKEFVQHQLFVDYINEANDDKALDLPAFVYEALLNDQQYYIDNEDYEMAGLLKDIINRFKQRLEYY